MSSIHRLGLFGLPGAGKSTVSTTIEQLCGDLRIEFARVRLADPLYEAQQVIYSIAGVQLPSFYSQDGALLNMLGTQLRRINPRVLLDRFEARVRDVEQLWSSLELHSRCLMICDDVRSPDADHLRLLGFQLYRIAAPPDECVRRRSARGDVSLGSADHATEQGLVELAADGEIDNSGDLEELHSRVVTLLRMIAS